MAEMVDEGKQWPVEVIERNQNVEQWFKKVKKVLADKIVDVVKTHPTCAVECEELLHLLQSIHPPFFVDKPMGHSQTMLPDEERCIALCDRKVRCFRTRYHQTGWLCSYHLQHLPFGVDRSCLQSGAAIPPDFTFSLSLRLVTYRGIPVFVDTVNNNVYQTEDVVRGSLTPRIIGKYAITIDPETLDEIYTIPALDVA